MKSLAILVCMLGVVASQLPQDGFKNYVTLFDYHYHQGPTWKVELPEDKTCVEFPADANQRISSIHTNGNCVILFQEHGCNGRGMRFEDFTNGYDNFSYLYSADNWHQSLRRCACNKCVGHNEGDTFTTERPINDL